MKSLFYKFFKNIGQIFSGFNLVWHGIAIFITFVFILTGFDWWYFKFFNNTTLQTILFSAAALGGLLPILLPLGLLLHGIFKKNKITKMTAFALGQAAILGSLVSSLYKAFTGRAHPDLFLKTTTDSTHVFHFGFLRGGIFWGWPSSHTTIAFAMAFALWTLFPQKKWLRFFAVLYAFYIGVGVSMSIHWFSDFAAGAILGTIIGITVGKSFYNQSN